MAILPIYTFAHAVLRKKARPFKGVNDAIVRLGHDMMETMHRANGIGLAANQTGVTQRIITVDLTGSEDYENFSPLIMLNRGLNTQYVGQRRWHYAHQAADSSTMRNR